MYWASYAVLFLRLRHDPGELPHHSAAFMML